MNLLDQKFVLATKEPAFEADSGELRAVLPKGADKTIDNVCDGYAYDDSSINIKAFYANGHLGVVELTVSSTCMGPLCLGDEEEMHMGLAEARDLRDSLDVAIQEAEDSLVEAWAAEGGAE